MRVVAGYAGNPPITRCSPAAALLQTIRLKAYSRKADLARRLHHIRPCAVTSPAKIDRVERGKVGRSLDRRRSLRIIRRHGRNVRRPAPWHASQATPGVAFSDSNTFEVTAAVVWQLKQRFASSMPI